MAFRKEYTNNLSHLRLRTSHSSGENSFNSGTLVKGMGLGNGDFICFLHVVNWFCLGWFQIHIGEVYSWSAALETTEPDALNLSEDNDKFRTQLEHSCHHLSRLCRFSDLTEVGTSLGITTDWVRLHFFPSYVKEWKVPFPESTRALECTGRKSADKHSALTGKHCPASQ